MRPLLSFISVFIDKGHRGSGKLSYLTRMCHITTFLDTEEGHGTFLPSDCHGAVQRAFSFQALSEMTNFFPFPKSAILVNQQLLRHLILHQLSLGLSSVSLVPSIKVSFQVSVLKSDKTNKLILPEVAH